MTVIPFTPIGSSTRTLLLVLGALVWTTPAGLAQNDIATATERIRELYFLRDYETAIAVGEQWRERAPDAVELRAWYALNVARHGDEDEGVAEGEALIAADSSNGWAWFGLAAALNWHDERGEEALAASERALALAPDDIYFVWLRTDVLREQEGEAAAIAYADELAPEFRDHPLVLVRKATALHFLSDQLDDEEKAKAKAEESYAVFAEARAADSTNVEAHFLPGTYLLNDGRNDEALPLLETAAALSPAPGVHSYYWRAIRNNRDLGPNEKRDIIDADVTSLLADRSDSPATLRAAASIYGDLGLAEKQQALEEHLLENYPDGPDAEWLVYDRILSFQREMYEAEREVGDKDPEKRARLRDMLLEFIDRPVHHEDRILGSVYTSYFLAVKDDTTFADDSIHALIQTLTKYDDSNINTVYGLTAVTLAERDIDLEEAEALALTGIEKTEEQFAEYKEEEVFADEERYQMAYDWSMASMYDALGQVYLQAERFDEAEENLLLAHGLADQHVGNLHHLGQLYERRHEQAASANDPSAENYLEMAEEYYIQGAMIQTFVDNPNQESLRRLYETRHGDLTGYEEYIANLEKIYRERRRERILSERLEEPDKLMAFELETLNESSIASDELAGKIVVINFWGTWCGPCVIEMPELQEFADRFRQDPEVLLLTINNDEDPDEVREWMAERGYDFIVLLDDGYVMESGIRAWPTTWFIDRDGRIVFEQVGASAALLEEFSWRVEALKGTSED